MQYQSNSGHLDYPGKMGHMGQPDQVKTAPTKENQSVIQSNLIYSVGKYYNNNRYCDILSNRISDVLPTSYKPGACNSCIATCS